MLLDTCLQKHDDLNEAWIRMRQLTLLLQEKLFVTHELQRFKRDADEIIAGIMDDDGSPFK